MKKNANKMNENVTIQCVNIEETGLIQVGEVIKLFLVEIIFDLYL